MQQTEFEGRWQEVGYFLAGELAWLDPGESGLRTHTATIGGKAVATIRTQIFGRGFTVNVPGWVWAKSLDGSAAEKLRIGEVEVKGFTTLREAKKAVKYAIECLPGSAGK